MKRSQILKKKVHVVPDPVSHSRHRPVVADPSPQIIILLQFAIHKNCKVTGPKVENEIMNIVHVQCTVSFTLAFCNNGSSDIVTSKMMCNHNISRNEKNSSKLVILQSFSILCYIFKKWEHFKSLNLIEFILLEGKPCPPAS